MSGDGSFVVVWSSYGQDGSSNGIFAQRFDPDCKAVNKEIQVNTASSGNQAEPAVAMDAAAGFVVCWQGPGLVDGADEDIFAQRFDPNGSPAGSELRVNSYSPDAQLYPSAALTGDGACIIVWESTNFPEAGTKAICGQLYDSNGVEFGAEFVVDGGASVYRYADVAADANGNFAVVWMQDKSSNSILGRLFKADGSAASDTFVVSTIRFSSVTRPAIAMNAAGYFVVVWDGDPELAGRDDIHARLFDPNGTPLGEQFTVNTTVDGAQQYPHVAMSGRGEFVIVWESRVDPNDAGGRDIFGQRFTSLGEPLGDEFCINTFIEGDQRYAAVAMREDGRFVTVWQSDGQDGSGYGIFADAGPKVGSADFNHDGAVDFRDYSVLAEEWLENKKPLTADLIDDNQINEKDLAEFCRQWLSQQESAI